MYKTDLFISALLQAARTVRPVCQFRASLALPDLFLAQGVITFSISAHCVKEGLELFTDLTCSITSQKLWGEKSQLKDLMRSATTTIDIRYAMK